MWPLPDRLGLRGGELELSSQPVRARINEPPRQSI